MAPEDLMNAPPQASQEVLQYALEKLNDAEIEELLPFADLTENQFNGLLAAATIRRIDSDDTVFHEGDLAENFYVMLDGYLRILRTTEEGENVVFLHVAPGQLFGIARAYENDQYTSTARAASNGLALSWPSELWEEFEHDYPSFSSASRQALRTRMHQLQDKIIEMSTKRVEQRIARALLRLVREAGERTDEGVEIRFPITRQDISDMTGATLHSVSRQMSNWQREGIVSKSRKRVVVCRPEALPV